MKGYWHSIAYFFRLPFYIQWRTALVQIPRFVPLSILHFTSPEGPHPFIISLPSRKNSIIHIYVFVPPKPVDFDNHDNAEAERQQNGEWKAPVLLDFHGGGFIMGCPLEQAPFAAKMSRELGAIVISVSYRIGPFHQFPAAIHDAEDVLSAILDTGGASKAGKVLRTEIQRYYSMVRSNALMNNETPMGPPSITIDPTHLSISGFSAGGNIALNMAISVPPCPEISLSATPYPSHTSTRDPSPADTISPLMPRNRAATMLNDVNRDWPSLLPSPQTSPTMITILLFYPSLDARLLPHERPLKPMPNALHANDKKAQKPRHPGLFSIMGPTYLPRKLRAHPRASPGLVNPGNVQKNAAIFLVLPEKDTLAVQSDVWVDQMNENDWNGPVRFGDGREGDWDGHNGCPAGSPTVPSNENGGLEVWHAPGCRHGWTQFPDTFVPQHERKERELVFARTLDFVKENWRKQLPGSIQRHESQVQDWRPLQVPDQ